MSIEQRFNAAVNVIRGLPKNGPYQPSNDMLLTFYSYFKQATKGKCKDRRPAFWDVVNRAKWDAWNRLGDMPKDVAMQKYVDKLKEIVETMSYTDNVATFMQHNMSELDKVSITDLEMVAPEAIQKVRSRPNSPLASREASPSRLSPIVAPPIANGHVVKPTAIINGYHYPAGTHHHLSNGNATGSQSDLSDDEYIDTVEDDYYNESATFRPIEAVNHSRQNHDLWQANHSEPLLNAEVASQITRTIERLNASVQQISNRIGTVEQTLATMRGQQQQQQLAKPAAKRHHPVWWPFPEVSPGMLAFIILWPLVVNRVTTWAQRRK